MQERNVCSWDEVEQEVAALRRTVGDFGEPVDLLFRGQADSEWLLETTLERSPAHLAKFAEYYELISRVKPHIESVTGKEWITPSVTEIRNRTREYDPFSLDLTFGRFPAYSYMVYLRHHGFPSPLLDWTRSLHVAGYFAFRTAGLWQRRSPPSSVSIYALTEKSIRVRGNRIPMIFRLGPYVSTHKRHFLQQSEYTICVRFEEAWRFVNHEEIANHAQNHQALLWKFNVPVHEASKALRRLDEGNVNAFSLYGSDESLMETMAIRELFLGDLRNNQPETAESKFTQTATSR